MTTVDDCFRIGSILKTRGLKGELQAFIDFEDVEAIKFNALFIETSAGKLVPYFIQSFKIPQKNTAYIYLEDIDHVDKAAVLTKKDIYLPNKLKPRKKKSQFTLMDLQGYLAIDQTVGELGQITDLQQLPQQVIATVYYQNHEVLLPLNTDIITAIDTKANTVTLNLPDGLLDIYLNP